MIVMKFGGSSLEDATALERVSGIIASRVSRRPLVVVSAMGKTTNKLLDIARTAAAGERDEALEKVEELRHFHFEQGRAVAPDKQLTPLKNFLDEHFQELGALARGLAVLGELTPRSIDAIASLGERMSSYVVALALEKQGVAAARVDSREIVITDDRHAAAAPILDETRARLESRVAPLLAEGKVVVMGGFIGATRAGVTSTLGRGGSDYTASLAGALLNAEEVEIWTDVDGVMTSDPTLVSDARRIRAMTSAEAAELAYFGARVLHPATMAPAVEKNIPIKVLNSRRPEIGGTRITASSEGTKDVVKSIAYKENITIVDIRSTRMLMAHGFLAHIFQTFAKHETAVDMVSTSEVSVSLTVDDTTRLDAVVEELRRVADVERRNHQAIVCVVGEGMRQDKNVSSKIFAALEGIGISMISAGASRLNVGFVVDEDDLPETVRRLHAAFFTTIDDTVFA